jgi:hypothetical protein
MQDINLDLPIEIAAREIEDAKRLACEYRQAIHARQFAGQDTDREVILLERFLDAIQNACSYYGFMIQARAAQCTGDQGPTLH